MNKFYLIWSAIDTENKSVQTSKRALVMRTELLKWRGMDANPVEIAE